MSAEKSYVFSQQPKPVTNRKKFREPILDFSRSNIMSDPRVVRGNTYAALVRPDSEESEMSRGASAISQRFRARRTRKQRDQPTYTQYEEEVIPQHEFLEELAGSISTHTAIDPDEMEQNDEDEVPFVPKPAGNEKGTWIEETDLFDFEVSVEPVLEVLIGKGLEQGMLEILSEEEMKVLEDRRTRWEQQRNSVHVEAQVLLSEKNRQIEEKDRRLTQAADKQLNDKVEQRRWGARNAAKDYMDEARDTVLERLKTSGHFYDPVVNQINATFMPWLLSKVTKHLSDAKKGRNSVENILHSAIAVLLEEKAVKAAEVAAAKAEADRIRAEEEAERKRMEEEIAKQVAEANAARAAALEAAKAEGDDEGDEE